MPYRTNLAYCYDGSFEGLLCCVYESYYQRELPAMIMQKEFAQETLFPIKEIVTDPVAAQKVKHSISHSISKEALRLVQLCYLSHMEERERTILFFLRLGYQYGPSVSAMLANNTVQQITKAAQNVESESHFYREFLRFSEFEGALFSIIEPKNFVLPLTGPHFCDRFPSERFLIYDETHKVGFLYENGQRELLPLPDFQAPIVSQGEKEYRKLWKQFYHTIAIEGRINHKRRMGHMPKRYWKHLTEFWED